MISRASIEKRFWKKVVPSPNMRCLEWSGYISPNGYGAFYPIPSSGKKIGAHRLSCEMAHGIAPPDKPYAIHACDNRKCVKPSHLRWGNASENAYDAVERNRHGGLKQRGENHHGAKLDIQDVIKIRNSAESPSSMAKRMNITEATIRDIRTRRSWKHLEYSIVR